MASRVSDPRISWVLEHINRTLPRPMGPAGLAGCLNLSTSHFRHIFSEQVGMGPVRYLQHLRMRRARLLIERTFLPVSRVMTLVGYDNPHRFARDFERIHGTSPEALRTASAATPLPSRMHPVDGSHRRSHHRAHRTHR